MGIRDSACTCACCNPLLAPTVRKRQAAPYAWAGNASQRRYGAAPLDARHVDRVTTKTPHLNRLGQLSEFEQESNTDSQQESNTESQQESNTDSQTQSVDRVLAKAGATLGA